MLDDLQKKKLLKIARDSIQAWLYNKKRPQVDETDAALARSSGAFVSLHEKGKLRGCIGYIEPVKPLYQAVQEMALEAAFNDPRFAPVAKEELEALKIEISVMSPLEKIKDPSMIKVGKHGILIRKGYYSGLLLPQVATQYNWGLDEFLENTCYKAGLEGDAWKKGADIYIFSCEVFGEQ